MTILKKAVSILALPVIRPLDTKAGAFWRRAGGSQGWHSCNDLMAGDWLNDLPNAIVKQDSLLSGMSRLFVMDPQPNPLFGAIGEEEVDVLGGVVPASFRQNILTVALDACAIRILLRISQDGLTETIPFVRPAGASPFVCGQSSVNRSVSFLVYRRFVDFVCGDPRTGTRVSDHARSPLLPPIFIAAALGNFDEAARRATFFFETVLNPSYAVPYRLVPGENRIQARSVAHEAEVTPILHSLLIVHPEIQHPSSFSLFYPAASTGIVRFNPSSLGAEAPIPHAVRERIMTLAGLAALNLPGHGTLTSTEADTDTTRGYCPADADTRLAINVRVASPPSAHEMIEAHVILSEFWRSESARPDLLERLRLVSRRDNPIRLREAIDAWLTQ